MISSIMMTPHEVAIYIAGQAQAKRLALNFSQKTLSERSGVSLGVLKKFEQTGQVSLGSLLKIAVSLDALSSFQDVFKPMAPEQFSTLDQLLAQNKKRKRGRK